MSGAPPRAQFSGDQAGGGTRKGNYSRAARLVKHADFERVYGEGQRHFARHMTFFFLPGEAGGSRVGLTVSRMLGGAVERNRIKRRLREAVRGQWLRLEGAAVDVVVNPKKSVLEAGFEEICQEVGRAFEVIRGKMRNPGEGGGGRKKS